MQKIVPHLWFDTQAAEAAEFYVGIFPDSSIRSRTALSNTPSGDVELLTISLWGYEFMLISAGPLFRFNPSVSFLVACTTDEEVDHFAARLGENGSELMPLGEYPFSQRYVWLQDKFGLSWQIMHMGSREIRQKITPTQMFVGDQAGRADEAMRFYTSLFPDSSTLDVLRYGPGAEPDAPESIQHGAFRLAGGHFALMDSAHQHQFAFNEAISYLVRCEDQEEIDYYWNALSADPASEQCGWLKDKFGFSWQIAPREMEDLLQEKDPVKLARVTQSFLAMKKFDLAELRRVARNA